MLRWHSKQSGLHIFTVKSIDGRVGTIFLYSNFEKIKGIILKEHLSFEYAHHVSIMIFVFYSVAVINIELCMDLISHRF